MLNRRNEEKKEIRNEDDFTLSGSTKALSSDNGSLGEALDRLAPASAPVLKKKTAAEKANDSERTRKAKTGLTDVPRILARMEKNNADLIKLTKVILLFTLSGALLGVILVGLALKEVSVHWYIILADIVTFFFAVLATISKLYTPPGIFSRKLHERAAKKEVDDFGRSIPEQEV